MNQISPGTQMLWDTDDCGGRELVEIIKRVGSIGQTHTYRVRIVATGVKKTIGHPALDGTPRLFEVPQ